MIKLAAETIPQTHLNLLADWLRTGPRLTKGELTKQLEEEFAIKTRSKYSVFVNSGSSANLLMIAYLKYGASPTSNKNIIVPALSWATDVAPLLQMGFNPILVDCDDLAIDIDQLEFLFKKYKPLAFLNVSILGFVEYPYLIKELCDTYNVILLEDNCESLGSSDAGDCGIMSTYSTYYGHHISTIEGGFITTNTKNIYEYLLMLRSHGWTRDNSIEWQNICKNAFAVDDFNEKYTFYIPGFNVRNTEIGAYLGLLQLGIMDDYCKIRNRNWKIWKEEMAEATHSPRTCIRVSNFALPLINLSHRESVVKACNDNNIECRPLVSGSMSKQPMFTVNVDDIYYTPNADKIHSNSMYLPNHAEISEKDVRFMVKVIKEVI